MKPTLPASSLHNPFQNRFNDPVRRRQDDMQAYAYMVWLRERNDSLSQSQITFKNESGSNADPAHGGRILAGTLALLVLLVSVAVLLRVA
jgi:hypothetical protein